jgi:hypothetical protein
MRIGLDIDDVIAGFWGSYCEYFDTFNNPQHLVNNTITKNVQRILKSDRDFWINLPVINRPNFNPTLYCTKRVNNKSWTRKFIEINNLPNVPIYQMFYQHGNKADMIKGKVDVFVDDSISNMIKMNLSGIPCLLMDTENNQDWGPVGRIFSLNKDEIEDTCELFKSTMFGYFKELCDEYRGS